MCMKWWSYIHLEYEWIKESLWSVMSGSRWQMIEQMGDEMRVVHRKTY
jgi:hypothetical protein